MGGQSRGNYSSPILKCHNTRFNQGLLADFIVCRVQEKILPHSVQFVPICLGAPATFQHLVGWVLHLHTAYSGAHHPQLYLGGTCAVSGRGPGVPKGRQEVCSWMTTPVCAWRHRPDQLLE